MQGETFLVSAGTEAILEQGRTLLDRHYDGRPFGWRQGGVSLRALATQLNVSPGAMYRCVSTASVWIQCGAPRLSHLRVSHLRELLPVSLDHRQRLLPLADREGWTVAELRRQCDACASPRRPGRSGRPRRPDRFAASLSRIAFGVSRALLESPIGSAGAIGL